jgi:hypothetical protein
MLAPIAQTPVYADAAAMMPPALNHVPDVRVPLWRPADNQGHYWPCELLHAFTLLMAAHGQCVNTDMMLGDAHYAHEKLSLAHSSGDESLRDLAVQLFAFFEGQGAATAAAAAH